MKLSGPSFAVALEIDSDRLPSREPAELDALLEHAFERYYLTSGLFGTPDACVAMVDRLKETDVDDVACASCGTTWYR